MVMIKCNTENNRKKSYLLPLGGDRISLGPNIFARKSET